MNTVNFGVRDNLSRLTGVIDVGDNVLLNFELLVERGHFPEWFLYRSISVHVRTQVVAIICVQKSPIPRSGVIFHDCGNYLRDNLSKHVIKINFAGNWLRN